MRSLVHLRNEFSTMDNWQNLREARGKPSENSTSLLKKSSSTLKIPLTGTLTLCSIIGSSQKRSKKRRQEKRDGKTMITCSSFMQNQSHQNQAWTCFFCSVMCYPLPWLLDIDFSLSGNEFQSRRRRKRSYSCCNNCGRKNWNSSKQSVNSSDNQWTVWVYIYIL